MDAAAGVGTGLLLMLAALVLAVLYAIAPLMLFAINAKMRRANELMERACAQNERAIVLLAALQPRAAAAAAPEITRTAAPSFRTLG
ncbi:MAG: hypothetical protein IT489_03140 [Gammaproteobacteria bacterium]|nr:hypothetical protein [Gammaproteobacteria bacterium]